MYTSVLGTCWSEAEIADRFDIDIDDVTEKLLDENIELCPMCGWWHESGELTDVDDPDDETIACPDCRKELKRDDDE